MRTFFSLLLLSLIVIFPVSGQSQCADTRTLTSKLYDKAIALYDAVMPVLLADPNRSIRFHLARTKTLYVQAKKTATSNPGNSILLAAQGQNHLTLLEKNIREIQNPKHVPFTDMFARMQEISDIQKDIAAIITEPCTAPLTVLMSFETRMETGVKKLYYESLLQ